MKQGVLITAFNEFSILKKLIDFFDDNFSLFIFLDKKSKLTEGEIDFLRKSKNVVFFSKPFNVNWGGTKQLKSRLMLAGEAVKHTDLDYFHFITGQDYPIKSCDYIRKFLKANKGKEFIRNSELPRKEWNDNGGLDRIRYYHFYDYFNFQTKIFRGLIIGLVNLQKLLKIRRKIPEGFPKLYGGSPFWTLSYPCLKYIIDYTKANPNFLKRFEYCFSATEIYFHTIIMNSPFKENVVNKSLRYIDYHRRNKSTPAILDETDYEKILISDALFARKFKYPISKKLITKIDDDLIKPFQ